MPPSNTYVSVTGVTHMDAFRIVDGSTCNRIPKAGCTRRRGARTRTRANGQSGTAIYFLLRAGERSHWHRVDATEIWHYYAGDPLELRTSARRTSDHDPRASVPTSPRANVPQLVVAPGAWQAARSLGAWTLVGCTVSPGFEFAGFELAPDGLGTVGGLI